MKGYPRLKGGNPLPITRALSRDEVQLNLGETSRSNGAEKCVTSSDDEQMQAPAGKALLAFSNDLQRVCRYCATVSYIRLRRLMTNPLPTADDLTATVTFIRFEDATYALTAGHVVKDFRASVAEPSFSRSSGPRR